MREFETGATRDTDTGKLEYAGFLSAEALTRFAEYMHEHRVQADGELRTSDNWKKGMPVDVYMQSMFRHFMDVFSLWGKGKANTEEIQIALCALFFNVQGMLHELLRMQEIADDTSVRAAQYGVKIETYGTYDTYTQGTAIPDISWTPEDGLDPEGEDCF